MTSTSIRLEVIEIPQPCPADWDAMKVVDGQRVRFCRHCAKNVYNLSTLSREAAEELVAGEVNAGQHICVRMYKRADGTVVNADCGSKWRTSAARWAARWGGPIGAALSMVLAVLGCEDHPPALMGTPPATQPVCLQGDVMLPAPPASQPAVLQGSIPPPQTPTPQPTTEPIMGKVQAPG